MAGYTRQMVDEAIDRDPTAASLYAAEEAAFERGLPGTVAGLMLVHLDWLTTKRYVEHVADDSWFRRNWPHAHPRPVFIRRGAAAVAKADGRIVLPQGTRGPIYLLHEIAHVAAGYKADHGPDFVSVYLALLRRYVGAPAANRLMKELTRATVASEGGGAER